MKYLDKIFTFKGKILIHYYLIHLNTAIEMRKYYLIILLGFIVWQCKPTNNKEKTYYFYNAKELFDYNILKNDSIHYLYYSLNKVIHPSDSFSINRGVEVYELLHYYKFSNYRDTSFIKPKSYLDSIDYYGKEWIKKEENLDKFWKTSHGCFDSLKIYTIEPIEGTDSLLFRRVHRFYRLFNE